MKVRELDFTLVVSSDMISSYKADIDVSFYESYYNELKFKLNLDVHESVRKSVRKFVTEYLVATGLYRKALNNVLRNMILFIDVDFSSKSDSDEGLIKFVLIKFVEDSEYVEIPSQSEFKLSHNDVPVLI